MEVSSDDQAEGERMPAATVPRLAPRKRVRGIGAFFVPVPSTATTAASQASEVASEPTSSSPSSTVTTSSGKRRRKGSGSKSHDSHHAKTSDAAWKRVHEFRGESLKMESSGSLLCTVCGVVVGCGRDVVKAHIACKKHTTRKQDAKTTCTRYQSIEDTLQVRCMTLSMLCYCRVLCRASGTGVDSINFGETNNYYSSKKHCLPEIH